MSKKILITLLVAFLSGIVYAVGPEYRTDKTGTYFKFVDSSNPVIYDNDVFDDIIDFDYLLCKASLGEVKLVGIIGTPVRPDGACIENWWSGSEGPFLKYEAELSYSLCSYALCSFSLCTFFSFFLCF